MTFQVPTHVYPQVLREMLEDADIAFIAETPWPTICVTAAFGRLVRFHFNEDGSLREIDAGDPDPEDES